MWCGWMTILLCAYFVLSDVDGRGKVDERCIYMETADSVARYQAD